MPRPLRNPDCYIQILNESKDPPEWEQEYTDSGNPITFYGLVAASSAMRFLTTCEPEYNRRLVDRDGNEMKWS